MFIFKLAFFFLSFSSFVYNQIDSSFQVRVLLDTLVINEEKTSVLHAPHGFTLSSCDEESVTEFLDSSSLVVTFNKKGIYLNNKLLGCDRIKIVAPQAAITLNGYTYGGEFLIMRVQQKVYIINAIDLEEYVYSVLRWESWPGWPLEVNKAFAIACRSYVVAKVTATRSIYRKKMLPYDIKSTNIHQTYKGSHEFTEVWQAIEETRGIVLAYKGKPIEAMYDCCCGGVIPSQLHGINFKEAPYLARSYACTYCKSSKLYSWSIEYDFNIVEKILSQHHEKEIKLKMSKVSKKDKAGTVQEVEMHTHHGILRLSGKKIYSLFKDIKSYHFSVQSKGKKLIFSGRGYGHHLGLCQWGSRQMVREGWDYKSILHFFYPETVLMKVIIG